MLPKIKCPFSIALNKESISIDFDCSWVRFVRKQKRAPVPSSAALQLVRKNLPLAQSLVSYFSRTLSLARTFLWYTITAQAFIGQFLLQIRLDCPGYYSGACSLWSEVRTFPRYTASAPKFNSLFDWTIDGNSALLLVRT
jgi:hypothetical protein